MAQKPTRLKRGDTLPIFSAILKDANGDAIDIKTGDVAEFYMREAESSRASVVSGGAMVIVAPDVGATDPDRGRVQYSWLAGDVDTPNRFDIEVRVTFVSGKIETFPNRGAHRLIIEDEIS